MRVTRDDKDSGGGDDVRDEQTDGEVAKWLWGWRLRPGLRSGLRPGLRPELAQVGGDGEGSRGIRNGEPKQ